MGYNAGEANLNGNQPTGMGWFPGYAIDLGTGERLNMAFGEDSWLSADNGKDMLEPLAEHLRHRRRWRRSHLRRWSALDLRLQELAVRGRYREPHAGLRRR